MTSSQKKLALGTLLILVFSLYVGAALIHAEVPEAIAEVLDMMAENLPGGGDPNVTPGVVSDPNEEGLEPVIDPSTWYPGENVLANYTFKNHYPWEVEALLMDTGDSWVSSSGGVFGGIDYFFQASCGDADDDEYTGMQGNIVIKSNTPGTLTINGQAQFKNDSYVAYDEPLINITESDLYFDADGYIRLYWRIDAVYTTFNYTMIYVRHWNGTGWHPIFAYYNNSNWIDQHEPWQIWFNIDDLYFTPTPISSHIRTRYHYTSASTKEYEFEIQNFEYGVNLTLTYNPSWNFQTINPSASYTTVSNSITFYDTIPVTYLLTFTETITQYFAAETYFHEGFEDNQYNSSIYFAGSFSERKTSGSRNWTTSDLEYGEYLVSFACYIEIAPSAVKLQFYNTSGWQDAASVNISLTDCWQTFLAEVHPTAADSSNIIRLAITGSGVVFWDEIFFLKSNIEARTSAYSQTTFSFVPNNLDGCQNPQLDNSELFNVSLIDRTGQNTVETWNRTNLRQITYDEFLDLQEYLIQVESCSTGNITQGYFTPTNVSHVDYALETYLDAPMDYENHYGVDGWSFSEGSTDNTTFLLATSVVEDGMLIVHPTAAAVAVMRIYFWNLGVNTSYYDYLTVRVKANVSDLYCYAADADNNRITEDMSVETDFSLITWEITDSDWSGTETMFQLRFDESGGDGQPEADNFVRIDVVRLSHKNEITLHESTDRLVLSCPDETLSLRTWSNQTFTSDYHAGEWIPKNQTIGTHSFEYCGFMREDEISLVYLPTTQYSYIYEVEDPFIVSIENFYLSDAYCNLFITATKSGQYYTYENNSLVASGTFQRTGSIINHQRNQTAGVLIELAYKFVNTSESVWFNTSYSNARLPTDYYRVYLGLSNQLGVGLPWETAKMYVNGSRQIYPELVVAANSTLNIVVKDYFNGTILSQSFSIETDTDITIALELYETLLKNDGDYPSELLIFKNNTLGYNMTVYPGEIRLIQLIKGLYDYRVYYNNKTWEQTGDQSHLEDLDTGKILHTKKSFLVSTVMPTVVDVSTPAFPTIPTVLSPEMIQYLTIITLAVLATLASSALNLIWQYLVHRRTWAGKIDKGEIVWDPRDWELVRRLRRRY